MKQVITIIAFILLGRVSVAQTAEVAESTTYVNKTFSALDQFVFYWVGRPYKLGGSTERGIDCSQLTKLCYKEVYGKDLANVAYKQWNQTQRVQRDSLEVGDLIFFRSKQSPSGWHCGIYIGNEMFFHAANRYEGVKLSSLTEPRYKNNIRGYGRLKTNN
jgi:lipoprotein Spr